MRGCAIGLLVFLFASWHSTATLALDCVAKQTNADRVLCVPEFRQPVDRLLFNLRQFANFVDEERFQEMRAEQDRWLDTLVLSCEQHELQRDTKSCLETGLLERSTLLSFRFDDLAGTRQYEPMTLGGLPLAIVKRDHLCIGDLLMGDTVVARCVYRFEPQGIYRNDQVDAMALVASSGGTARRCANFPVYVVSVTRDRKVEIVRVPARHPVTGGDDACLKATRSRNGFVFEVAPSPERDGWRQEWTVQAGLSPPSFTKFVPVAGTTEGSTR
jgi:hypothetical protein